jgi:hypothetical protein
MSDRENGVFIEGEQGVNVAMSPSAAAIEGIDPKMRQLAGQLESWVTQTRSTRTITGGSTSMFDRGKYIASDNPYDQMKIARTAVRDDDVVASTLELTEGLAFQGVKWESGDWDTSDIFNQMAAEQNLDGVLRKMWREEFTESACTLAFWWDQGEFTVRGKSDKGNKRKRTVKVWYPRAISVLDGARVVPVGLLAFGQERLVWRATKGEMQSYDMVAKGRLKDELFDRFYDGRYTVSDADEAQDLIRMKVDTSRLLLLDERYVRRYTRTKPDYERFPNLRLKSVFRLLDMKQQLMEADRVALVGAANYILLVKKGDEKDPAYPEEIANLKENYHTLAKLPVIFSDHRLNIEIISPKTDFTLRGEKYDALDSRIAARLLSTMAVTKATVTGTDSSIGIDRPVARALENSRHMMRRFVEREIAKAVVNHPKNAGIFTEGTPSLAFTPPNIQIDSNAALASTIMQARTMRDLSRESFLEYFGFDQEVEAMRMELEEEKYDDIFQTAVPFNSPANAPAGGAAPPAAQGPAGNQGGRPVGGGKPKQSPQAAPKKTATGNTSTGGSK